MSYSGSFLCSFGPWTLSSPFWCGFCLFYCTLPALPLLARHAHWQTDMEVILHIWFWLCSQLCSLIFMVDFLPISYPHPVPQQAGQAPLHTSDMTDRMPPMSYDIKAPLLSGMSAFNSLTSFTSLKFVVLSAVFFSHSTLWAPTSDHFLIFNQQEHLPSSINLTRRTACPSQVVTYGMLEKQHSSLRCFATEAQLPLLIAHHWHAVTALDQWGRHLHNCAFKTTDDITSQFLLWRHKRLMQRLLIFYVQ